MVAVIPKPLGGVVALALLSLAGTTTTMVQARDDLQVLREENYAANNSTIVWYTAAEQQSGSPSRPRRAPRACGDNTVTCTSKALARADTCAGLFDYLSDKRTAAPPRNSVAVCWVDPNFDPRDNNQCCTAWREWGDGIVMGYLLGAATKTWNQCKTGDGLVGGVTNEVILNGVCQSQCLGNTRECF